MSFPTYAHHGSGLAVDRYPADLYAGETGEVSATLHRADAEHDLVYPSGGSADYLATGVTTEASSGSTAGTWQPRRADLTRTSTSPCRVVLRSRRDDPAVRREGLGRRPPGDYMFVPEGGVHGFRNESGEPASMLILFAPGAPREGYFEGLAEWATGPKPTDDERAEFMLRHDTFWV